MKELGKLCPGVGGLSGGRVTEAGPRAVSRILTRGSSTNQSILGASALIPRCLGQTGPVCLTCGEARGGACQRAPPLVPLALLTLSLLLSQVQVAPWRPASEVLRLPPLRRLSLTGLPLPALAAAQLLRGRGPGSQGTRAGDPGPTPLLPPRATT